MDGYVILTTDAPIFTSFRSHPDPRHPAVNLKNELFDRVALTLCTIICNTNAWVDVEQFGSTQMERLRKFLKLENGIPSYLTLGRTFAARDTHAFSACVAEWIAAI